MSELIDNIRALSLREFVLAYPVSNRVQNSISRAEKDQRIPFGTIGEYIDDRYADIKLMKIDGIGKKGLLDFKAILEDAMADKIESLRDLSSLSSVNAAHNISIIDLVNRFPVSVRTYNSISEASKKNILSFNTVKEYIEAGADALKALMSIDNMGRKSAYELDSLIREYCKTNSIVKEVSCLKDPSITLVKFVDIYNVSTRLFNAIKLADENKKLEVHTIKDYWDNPCRAKKELIKLDNMGHNTVDELDIAITNYCSNQDKCVNLHADFNETLKQILTEKEISILKSRSLSRKTLEDLGKKYGVTRERIRQIEKKSIAKLSVQLKTPLVTLANELDQELDEAYGEIPLRDFLSKHNLSGLELRFLLYISGDYLKQKTSITYGCIYRKSNIENFSDWNNLIDDCLYASNWPVNLDSLRENITDIPETYINQFLIEKRKATIENNIVVEMGRMPQEARMTYVLRKANRPLNGAELADSYEKMFGIRIKEHNARSIVARMENALIVARGKYALYETIGISEELAEYVRDATIVYLKRNKKFISSKVLYQDLMESDINFNTGLIDNEYVLHGILQDDNRFIIQRGLMIGLKEYGDDICYTPLTEEIYKLVESLGPISVTKIKEELSNHRNVLTVTITMMLKKDVNIVKISPGLFSSIHKVFGSKSIYDDFITAIKILLINKKSTIYSLVKELRSIEIFSQVDITNSLVLSVINKIQDVENKDSIYSLPATDNELNDYNNKINELLSSGLPSNQVIEKVGDVFGFTRVDYRLITDKAIIKDEGDNNNEISSILHAFGI